LLFCCSSTCTLVSWSFSLHIVSIILQDPPLLSHIKRGRRRPILDALLE
jgi:hypothetical protein